MRDVIIAVGIWSHGTLHTQLSILFQSNETIHRAALGRVAKLGDLYDARTDQFCGTSVLSGPPPDSTVISLDTPSVRTELISSNSLSDKFKALDIESDLQASVVAGLVELDGHARYLSDESRSMRDLSGALLYSLTTEVC